MTIEQTGGSGITVPGYGFLLNNELTDFNFKPIQDGVPDPNLPGPGKRPRSSMSPTILFKHGQPWLAVGSPGGASIITTVTQVTTGYIDRDLSLVDAIAAPRFSSRNGATSQAEPAIAAGPLGAELEALGHALASTPKSVQRPQSGSCPTAASWPQRRPPDVAAAPRPSSDPRASVAKLGSPDRGRPRSTAQQYFRQGAPYR